MRRNFSATVPVDVHVLGFTNTMSEGSIGLFDQTGKELASLQNHGCGFVRGVMSWDLQVGIAVCEKTGLDEAHFGETLRREAVVFDAKTLKAIATIPMSQLSLKERGSRDKDFWVTTPSPAIWHGDGRVFVAIPDFSNSISLYSISEPTPTTR
jgi:hypothetical protein